jgi:hypothetical protein
MLVVKSPEGRIGVSTCFQRKEGRCNMLTNSFAQITTVLLSGSLAVMLALTSPAAARGGGHHHGECGEHHVGYDCGNLYTGHHHRRQHEHYFEDHHRSEYLRDIRYIRQPERMPLAPDASTGSAEPK